MNIKIGNKPNLIGRKRQAHIHRKCMMPPENMQDYAAKLDKINWSEPEPVKRTYKIRVNGKLIYSPEKDKK